MTRDTSEDEATSGTMLSRIVSLRRRRVCGVGSAMTVCRSLPSRRGGTAAGAWRRGPPPRGPAPVAAPRARGPRAPPRSADAAPGCGKRALASPGHPHADGANGVEPAALAGQGHGGDLGADVELQEYGAD